MKSLLTDDMIKRETVMVAYYSNLTDKKLGLNDHNLKIEIDYKIATDQLQLKIKYKDEQYITDLAYNSRLLSLDSFAEIYCIPAINELLDRQNMYDDAGQII